MRMLNQSTENHSTSSSSSLSSLSSLSASSFDGFPYRGRSVQDLEILLYNKVKLQDDTVGVVRYIGNLMGKQGVFYGIDVIKGNGKNNVYASSFMHHLRLREHCHDQGTLQNIKYFDTKHATKTGRFVRGSKIVNTLKTTRSNHPFQLGDTVQCTKAEVDCKGTVKYIGCPCWVKGGRAYYGLELVKKKGTGNGSKNGVQYFEAKMHFGIYVRHKHVAAGV